MQWSPSTVRQLVDDDAVSLSMEEDIVFAGCNDWVLAFMRPEEHFEPSLVEYLRQCPGDSVLDFRAVCAVEVDLDEGKFLPPSSRKFLPLAVPRYGYRPRMDAQRCRAWLEEETGISLYGEVVSLTDLHREGKAIPVYPRSGDYTQSEGRTLAKEASVLSFQFKYADKVVGVRGGYLMGFQSRGLEVYGPLVRNPASSQPPAMGMASEDGSVIGLVRPVTPIGPSTLPDGRDLFADAGTVCWYSAEDAYEMMRHRNAHPLELLDEPLEKLLHTRGISAYATACRLRTAVGILRWNGLTEEQIEEAYLDTRSDALNSRYALAMEVGVQAWTALQEGTHGEAKHLRAVANAREELAALEEATGADLEWGPLETA